MNRWTGGFGRSPERHSTRRSFKTLAFTPRRKYLWPLLESVAVALNATGVTEVNNNTAGTFRDVAALLISSGGTITLSNCTVATLPTAASNTHAIVAVTDGNASPTYRGAVTGGGSTKGVVYCDGSSWMWHSMTIEKQTVPYCLNVVWDENGKLKGAAFYEQDVIRDDGVIISVKQGDAQPVAVLDHKGVDVTGIIGQHRRTP